MKNAYKTGFAALIILLQTSTSYGEEAKKKVSLLPTQENKVYYYLTSFAATSWGLYENIFKTALPVDYLESKGIRVETPDWKPSAAHIQLGKDLHVSEATAKELLQGVRTRNLARGTGWGSLAFMIGFGIADYYGYIPKASENQEKNLTEKPSLSKSNSQNQTAAAH